jgi:prephenate dehydratase
MGTFNTSKTVVTAVTNLDYVENTFKQHFENQGFNVTISKNTNGFFASITKGNIFKAVLGMKTSLNIEVRQVYNGIFVEAKVGVFGQQVLPSVITLFLLWPVMLTQIAGLVSQAKLDNQAIHVIEQAIRTVEKDPSLSAPAQSNNFQVNTGNKIFCEQCGNQLNAGAKFCSSCGKAK